MTEILCACPLLSQSSLVIFLIENSLKLFGEDLVLVCYENLLFHTYGEKDFGSYNNLSNLYEIKIKKHGHSSCTRGWTCTSNHDALSKSPNAPFHKERIIDAYNVLLPHLKR